jgi:hypothetical protein
MSRVLLLDLLGATSWGIPTARTLTFVIALMFCVRGLPMEPGSFQAAIYQVEVRGGLACLTPLAMAKCTLSFLMALQVVLEWADLLYTTTHFLVSSNGPKLQISLLEM